jgi:hypothetical protein
MRRLRDGIAKALFGPDKCEVSVMLPIVIDPSDSFESYESTSLARGSRMPALRKVREGQGTHRCDSVGSSKAGPPAQLVYDR